jgi:hypothetical protein
MASPTQSSDFSPLAADFREMLAVHLPESSSEAIVVLHSAPLVQTAYNVLRNLIIPCWLTTFGSAILLIFSLPGSLFSKEPSSL